MIRNPKYPHFPHYNEIDLNDIRPDFELMSSALNLLLESRSTLKAKEDYLPYLGFFDAVHEITGYGHHADYMLNYTEVSDDKESTVRDILIGLHDMIDCNWPTYTEDTNATICDDFSRSMSRLRNAIETTNLERNPALTVIDGEAA